MNLDNFINTAENDCANIIKVILKKPEIKKFLNYQGFKLHEAYYKTLIPIFFSTRIINFYKRIKNKEIKIKEIIKVYSLEEKLLINELKIKFKLNSKYCKILNFF